MINKLKLGWFITGILLMTLSLFAISCGGSTPNTSTPVSTPTAGTQTSATATQTSTNPTQTSTDVESTESTEQAGSGPPPVPHSLAGRENCLACHDQGGIKPFPADHIGRPSSICLSCHQAPAGESTATATPTSEATPTETTEATATETEAPATETEATESNTPPNIPHTLTGRTDCLMCHATGVAGAPAVPSDHAGRTNDTCQMCHKQ